MTLDPVLQPRSVTMWLLMESYSRPRCSLLSYATESAIVNDTISRCELTVGNTSPMS
jgi:hypothetical protein